MKTIRNQLKFPIDSRVSVFLLSGIKNCRFSIFMQLQKEQKIENKQKISSILSENNFDATKPYLALTIFSIARFLTPKKIK